MTHTSNSDNYKQTCRIDKYNSHKYSINKKDKTPWNMQVASDTISIYGCVKFREVTRGHSNFNS
jgi:hypothetical protein